MLKIALTGNIASGKTQALTFFKEQGINTLCLDEVVQTLYLNSKELKSKLKEKFNTSNKQEISKIVFDDINLLRELEEIIFPFIKAELFNFFDKNKSERYVIVAAPVLFESGFDKYFDKIIFISADEKIRLQRLMKRNNIIESEAIKRMNSQKAEEVKISKSDFIVKNNGTIEELKIGCLKITEELKLL